MIPRNRKGHDLKGEAPYFVHLLNRVRFAPWFWSKEFSTDWASEHFTVWNRVLAYRRRDSLRILEIGSWEGRSSLFFLNYFRHSTIVCIDTFEGTDSLLRHPQWARQIANIEERFDRNLASFGDRVEKIKSCSRAALDVLASDQRSFDLVYIDGDHRRESVWQDTVRAWPLVPPGGIVIWDDYGWHPLSPPDARPQPAIDAFLQERLGSFELLAKGYQMIVRRIA
jgi:predicted O-methyltransferase YrrM